jgi:hypothetical protein
MTARRMKYALPIVAVFAWAGAAVIFLALASLSATTFWKMNR